LLTLPHKGGVCFSSGSLLSLPNGGGGPFMADTPTYFAIGVGPMHHFINKNDSLHAYWKNVQKSQIESCIAFIESLLVKHFS
jgi:hypothetical protein